MNLFKKNLCIELFLSVSNDKNDTLDQIRKTKLDLDLNLDNIIIAYNLTNNNTHHEG